MRSLRSSGYFAAVLSFSLLLLTVPPTFAVVKTNGNENHVMTDVKAETTGKLIKESIKNRDGRKEFTPAELEEMRTALLELLSSTQYATPMFEKGQAARQATDNYNALNAQIQQLSTTELTAFRTALNPASIQEKLRIAMEKINDAKSQSSSRLETAGLPAIAYYCQGQASELGISAPVSPSTLSASDDIFFIAEGVRDLAQNACNQVAVVVVLGEGGGANTRLLCNISDAVYLVAKALNQKYHFCDSDYDSSTVAANFERLGHIHTDLENSVANDNTNKTAIITNDNTNKTSIVNNDNTNKTAIVDNDNTNKTAIVTNDNTNKDTILTNANANYTALNSLINAALASIIGNANANKDEMKNLLLRTQIEADLSVNDGQPFVGLYQLPASVCFPSLDSSGAALAFPQQCGLLDLVRSITLQTIVNTGNDSNAMKSFNKADAYKAQGKYPDAYKNYRKAYKEAVKY